MLTTRNIPANQLRRGHRLATKEADRRVISGIGARIGDVYRIDGLVHAHDDWGRTIAIRLPTETVTVIVAV